MELYRALHARGVVHESAKAKHWIWDGERVRLIDFGTSFVRAASDVPGWMSRSVLTDDFFEQAAKVEMQSVRRRLGLADA